MEGKRIGLGFIILVSIIFIALYFTKAWQEKQLLKKIIERLTAESRITEVLVTEAKVDPKSGVNYITIKFLEYGPDNKPLEPRYFTFTGNIIQFQSLVIRFDDFYIEKAHPLKGKSAYIFMKAFALTDNQAQVFDINKINEIPSGYEVQGARNSFERKLWKQFWQYALDPKKAKEVGIKNAQIEAPGTKFVSGMLYTIKIEHDGGMRIDAQPLPKILKGENIKF